MCSFNIQSVNEATDLSGSLGGTPVKSCVHVCSMSTAPHRRFVFRLIKNSSATNTARTF